MKELRELGAECLKEHAGLENINRETPPSDDASGVLVGQEIFECTLDQVSPDSFKPTIVDFLMDKLPKVNGSIGHQNLSITFENPGDVRTGKCYVRIVCWDHPLAGQ
jgi:hypothetical protein